MQASTSTIKRRVAAVLSKMSTEEARALLAEIAHNEGRGRTVDNGVIRRLTGGYASQSLNEWVGRKVGVRAGLLPKWGAR